jgi:predicted dehydrogenase
MSNKNTTSRRSLFKQATTVASALVLGVSGESTEAEAAPQAPKAQPAPSVKIVGKAKIPVPVIDAVNMRGGLFPKGTVLAAPSVKGANDRITIASIGVGGAGIGQGKLHLNNFLKESDERNTAIVAVCDVYQPFVDETVALAKAKQPNVAGYSDYRKVLERKDIDAVIISTPEHWHGQILVHAMQAGKHAYSEKPLVRYIEEAWQVVDTAKATKAVVQIGSQGCTDVRWHAAAKAIKDGSLGKIVMGQGSYCRCNRNGEWNYQIPDNITPENFDWDLWLGSAPSRPFASPGGAARDAAPERTDAGARFRRYRKYKDYSAGILGDLMPHRLHPFLIASGNPEYPTKVMAIGTHGVQNKDREISDTVQMIAEFPSGWSMLFLGSTVNEQGLPDMIRGEKASVYFGSTKVEVKPERPYSDEVEGFIVDTNAPELARYSPTENIDAHERNWLEAIRKNDPSWCNCGVELAAKAQTILSLAEMSERLGKAMHFDAKTRKVTS